MMKLTTKQVAIFLILIAALIGFNTYYFYNSFYPPIKIGILHSLTGGLEHTEKPIVEAELLAIEEINAQGGVLHRKIIPVVVDCKSDNDIFAKEAERLITQEKIDVLVGTWDSSARKSVKAIVEKYNKLLIYPCVFEGAEVSPNVLYVGADPNQQIIPAILWSMQNLGKKFFLASSSDVWARLVSEVVKLTLSALPDAQMVGEEYTDFDDTDVTKVLDGIIQTMPDVIFNTMYGESGLAFFKGLRARGITPEKIPIMTTGSISETEFAYYGNSAMAGDYVASSYFQSIDNAENNKFISHFKKRYGADQVVSESEEGGYISIYLLCKAIESAKSTDLNIIKKHLYNLVLNCPGGLIYIDNEILSTWKFTYIGKLRSDGQFTIVWDSGKAIAPNPFPLFKTEKEWLELGKNIYDRWNKK